MTGLIIAAAAALALALTMLLPVIRLHAEYSGKAAVYLRVLVWKIMIYPRKKKEKKRPAEKKTPRTEKKKPALSGALSSVGEILSAVGKKIGFKVKKLKISVGFDDAAVTAVAYGSVCAICSSLMGIAGEYLKLKVKSEPEITADFISGKTSADVHLVATGSIAGAISILRRVLTAIKKSKNEDEKNTVGQDPGKVL